MVKKRDPNRRYITPDGEKKIIPVITQNGSHDALAKKLRMNPGTFSSKLKGHITLSLQEAEEMYNALGKNSELDFLHAYATNGPEAAYSPQFLIKGKNIFERRREEEEALEARITGVVKAAIQERESQQLYDLMLTPYFAEINEAYSKAGRVNKLGLLTELDQLITKYS
jgi:hypothetical protein